MSSAVGWSSRPLATTSASRVRNRTGPSQMRTSRLPDAGGLLFRSSADTVKHNHLFAAENHILSVTRAVVGVAWSVALGAFIGAQGVEAQSRAKSSTSAAETRVPRFDLVIECGPQNAWHTPKLDRELARLFAYAEEGEGTIVNADVTFYTSCSCPDRKAKRGDLMRACHMDTTQPVLQKVAHCVQSYQLRAREDGAGMATLCFPSPDQLPLRSGFRREKTATYERIRGRFLVWYEWSLGAPHVMLLIEE